MAVEIVAGRTSDQRAVKRRFGRSYSLRSLLILVTLSAIGARFVGAEFLAYEAEQQGLAALDTIGSVRPFNPSKIFL